MAPGNKYFDRIMQSLHNVVTDGDPTTAARSEIKSLMLWVGVRDYTQSVTNLHTKLLHDIGYCAGYLSSNAGTTALQAFKTTHPLFGDTVPDITAMLEQALKTSKAVQEKAIADAAAAKTAALKMRHGVTIDPAAMVTTEDARTLLAALRADRDAKAAVVNTGVLTTEPLVHTPSRIEAIHLNARTVYAAPEPDPAPGDIWVAATTTTPHTPN